MFQSLELSYADVAFSPLEMEDSRFFVDTLFAIDREVPSLSFTVISFLCEGVFFFPVSWPPLLFFLSM